MQALKQGDAIVRDTLPAHKPGSIRERIEAVISTGSDPDDPEDD